MKYLLPAFFIVFALGEITRIQFPNAVAVNLIDPAVLVLALLWVKKRKGNYELGKPILLFALVGLVSLVFNFLNFKSSEILVASLYLLRWVSFSLLYFVARDMEKADKEKTLRYMSLTGLFFVGLGFLQYFSYPALRNLYYLGWDEHLNRLFGSFFDPNFAGAFIVLFIIFLFIIRDSLLLDKRLIHLGLLLSLVALVLTYSRGAFLMLLVSAGIYSVLTKNFKLIAGLLVSFVILFVILSPNFKNEGTNLLRTASIFQRLESGRQGAEIFKENPLLGVGFNNLRYAREKYGFRDDSDFGPSHSGAGVENSFVFVLATTGVVGFLAYIYLLYSMLRLGINRRGKNKMGLVLVVSLSGLVVNALVMNSLFFSFLMIWIWIIAGLTENN